MNAPTSSTIPSRRKPLWRRALRAVGILALAVVALVLAALAYLHTSAGQELLRSRIEHALAGRVNGSVRLERVGFHLFGSIDLDGLTLSDGANAPVVKLHSLTVRPAWGALLSGNIAIESVSLDGLALNVEQYADGSSNLKRLFKPSPPKAEPKEKKARRIEVGSISLANIGLTLKKPDGSLLELSNVHANAKLDGIPVNKTVSLVVDSVGLSLSRQTASGVRIAVDPLETSLEVNLVEAKGQVKLGKVSGKARIERPNAKPFATDISLGGIALDVDPKSVSGTLNKLALGLALLDSLELRAETADGALAGDQKAVLAGLHLDGDRANALIGRPLLKTDVDIATKIAGPPSALALSTNVKTAGGRLSLDGTLDASKLEKPGFDLTLIGNAIAARKLLSGDKVPDVEVERVQVGLKGSGAKRDELQADVNVALGAVRFGRVSLTDGTLRGRIEHGVFTIHDLTLHALGQTVKLSGSYGLADRSLNAKVSLKGDAGKALAELKKAGVPLRTQIPPGFIRANDGELLVEVEGKLDEGLTVRLPSSKIAIAGGRIQLDGSVSLAPGPPDETGKKKLGLDRMDADVTLSGVRLSSLLAVRGKKLRGLDGRVSGKVSVSGTKAAPRAKLDLRIALARTDSAATSSLQAEIRGRVEPNQADVSLTAYRVRAGAREDELVKLDAHLPLSGKSLSQSRELDVKLDLPRRTLKDILELLPPEVAQKVRLPRDSEVEAHLQLAGRAAAPDGSFAFEATTRAVPWAPTLRQKISLHGTIAPEGSGTSLKTKLEAWLDDTKDALVVTHADARFARSPLLRGGAKDLDWKLATRVGPTRLDQLPLPPGKGGLSGSAGLALDFSGNRHDVTGRANLGLDDFHKNGLGPIAAKLGVDIAPERANLALDVNAVGLDALRARGEVGLAGKGLLDRAREKKLGDPSLSLDLELPRHRLAEWAALRPKLATLLGAFGGKLAVRGSVKQPLADGELSLDGFDMLDGKAGRAAIGLSATADELATRVSLGPNDDAAPLSIRVSAKRDEALRFLRTKEGDAALAVALSARAAGKPFESLVPRLTASMPEIGASGTLDWDMRGAFALASHDGQRRLEDATLEGLLSLDDGRIPLPKSSRHFDDVQLKLSASREALRVERLHLEESDREKKKRTFDLEGDLAWTKLRPQKADLRIRAKDFLLFGTELLGKPDAPRAALSADIEVRGDLSTPRRRIDAVVNQLALYMPERFEKAHWPEEISSGDVFFVGEAGAPAVGKLPVAEKKPVLPPVPAVEAADAPGTDVHLHVAHPIHIQKPPFEFVAKGDLDVKIRAGHKPAIDGELVLSDGAFQLGGRKHPLDKRHKSRIFFDAAHPGELDLWLAVVPNPAALQDISKLSAGGDDVRLHLTGPIGQPVSNVTGVGNADLWDILPVHNAGRVKFTSKPDMPATETVQVPREYDVVLLSYMALNLPHNLFLDRMNAWADPYDDRFSYGRIQHMEADHYSKNGKTRIRANARPPTMGQSNAELEAGYLFLNHPREKAGAAVVAGSRLGGGPALFFEWSSEE